jgi:superfamily I DNA/RNA helicase
MDDRITVINAGPGTGKTTALVSRLNSLLENGSPPADILVLTFTKKASEEIKERLNTTHQPFIGTFHGFAHQFLKENGFEIKIISENERKDIIKKISKNKDFELIITQYINSIKKKFKNYLEEIEKYESELKKINRMDYDTLLFLLYETIHNTEVLRKKLQQRYKYILVDEFQDTNALQYEILKEIVGEKNKLFVIGDPHQSIYSFRGADSSIFERVKSDFPQHTSLSLDINYRSIPQIVETSTALFNGEVSLSAFKQQQGEVQIIKTMNEYTEADWIVNKICNKMGGLDLIQSADKTHEQDNTVNFSDFAVIYRTHFFARYLEKKFIESGIPYQMIGEESPYEQKEIKAIIERLYSLQGKTGNEPLSKVVKDIINASKIETEIKDKPHEQQKLQSFFSTIIRFDHEKDGLEKFLKYVDYLKDHEFYDKSADKVTLMTIHAAKGLEFEYVFICGFEDGIIPLINKKEMNLDEEKRLLYVAMTRAKTNLYLTYTKERYKKSSTISRFYNEIKRSSLYFIEDEVIKKVEKKRAINKDKKSQLSLF